MDVRHLLAAWMDSDGRPAARRAYQFPLFSDLLQRRNHHCASRREMPYGYLTKPFQSGELKHAAGALAKCQGGRAHWYAAHRIIGCHHERNALKVVLMVSTEGRVEFMTPPPRLAGWTRPKAKGRTLHEVLESERLQSMRRDLLSSLRRRKYGGGVWLDTAAARRRFVRVGSQPAPLAGISGPRKGFVITVRDAPSGCLPGHRRDAR